jgi:hypothetical protein
VAIDDELPHMHKAAFLAASTRSKRKQPSTPLVDKVNDMQNSKKGNDAQFCRKKMPNKSNENDPDQQRAAASQYAQRHRMLYHEAAGS